MGGIRLRWFIGSASGMLLNILIADGLVLVMVVVFGHLRGTLITLLATTVLSSVLLFITQNVKFFGTIAEKLREWGEHRKQIGRRMRLLINFSRPIGLVTVGVVLDPFTAAIATRIFGYEGKSGYPITILAAAAYSLVWAGVLYGTGVDLIRFMINRM